MSETVTISADNLDCLNDSLLEIKRASESLDVPCTDLFLSGMKDEGKVLRRAMGLIEAHLDRIQMILIVSEDSDKPINEPMGERA